MNAKQAHTQAVYESMRQNGTPSEFDQHINDTQRDAIKEFFDQHAVFGECWFGKINKFDGFHAKTESDLIRNFEFDFMIPFNHPLSGDIQGSLGFWNATNQKKSDRFRYMDRAVDLIDKAGLLFCWV